MTALLLACVFVVLLGLYSVVLVSMFDEHDDL